MLMTQIYFLMQVKKGKLFILSSQNHHSWWVRRQCTQRAVPERPSTFGQELAVMTKLLGKALAHAHTVFNLDLSCETIERSVLISEKPTTKKAYLCFPFLSAESFSTMCLGLMPVIELNCVPPSLYHRPNVCIHPKFMYWSNNLQCGSILRCGM